MSSLFRRPINSSKLSRSPADEKRDRDVFRASINAAPKPEHNKLVFRYDYRIEDYNFASCIHYGFDGTITKPKIKQIAVGLKRAVSMYKVPRSAYVVGDGLCCLFSVVGLILVVFGMTRQKEVFSGVGFFVCFLIGIVANCVVQWFLDQRLLKREKQIRAFLDIENKALKEKGIKWSTGKYGAYLMLTYTQTDEFFGKTGVVAGCLNQGSIVLNTEAGARLVGGDGPAEMENGSDQPQPRVVIQTRDGRLASRYQPPTSAKLEPPTANPRDAGTKDSLAEMTNNIVISS